MDGLLSLQKNKSLTITFFHTRQENLPQWFQIFSFITGKKELKICTNQLYVEYSFKINRKFIMTLSRKFLCLFQNKYHVHWIRLTDFSFKL